MIASLAGFASLFALCFAGVPLAISMLLVGAIGFMLFRGSEAALTVVAQQVTDAFTSHGLSVIPLFILMGTFIHRAGLADDLFSAARAWLGHLRGGMAHATIGACGGFSAVCGSSIATAATMARVSLPQMKRYGYDDGFACGTVAAGGTLGILIPPSVPFVIYGILTETDITKLFMAGLVPGLLLAAMYMLTAWTVVLVRPSHGRPAEKLALRERLQALGRTWAVLALFAGVLGGMYFGVFTPTEGAGVGAAGGFLFMVMRGKAQPAAVRAALLEAARTTAALLLVTAAAMVFNNFLTIAGLTNALVDWVQALQVPPLGIIVAICLIYVVLGCVFDSLAAMFLTVPVFVPIILGLGLDPIGFGVLVVIVVELGLITPPVGMNVFIVKALVPEVGMWRVFAGVAPFVVANVLCLTMVIAFPAIATFLPGFVK
ncbi:MAG: TRAP transporter large permease [Ramlibacter sp.]